MSHCGSDNASELVSSGGEMQSATPEGKALTFSRVSTCTPSPETTALETAPPLGGDDSEDAAPVSPLSPKVAFAREVSGEFGRQYSTGFGPQVSTGYGRGISSLSNASQALWADPKQTLIFLDWDDTLFPTTDIFKRWCLSSRAAASPRQEEALQKWEEALKAYLEVALTLGRVVIVTNSEPPWVDTCVDNFIPSLKPLLQSLDAPRVVYARQVLRQKIQRRKIRSLDNLRPVASVLDDEDYDQQEFDEVLRDAKYYAMKAEAENFYSSYANQTWKNILSLGDMEHEFEAVQELVLRRRPLARERLRVKTLLLPTSAPLSELTLRLRFSELMLPAYVHHDGDFEANLKDSLNPLQKLAELLDLPGLASSRFPLCAWGHGDIPSEDVLADALGKVANVIQKHLRGED
eukprot:TRINITY_DN106654_c0_g1_i1.p1 TRINITY_DN106654_c0_g1~~TRINITY_DN106654_c0_g1_i1.p1  ORF type:complete len:406 (+),score=79.39 TRINITY_DN106654_c0_g1_i1:16-1233(+)